MKEKICKMGTSRVIMTMSGICAIICTVLIGAIEIVFTAIGDEAPVEAYAAAAAVAGAISGGYFAKAANKR
jgi:hypothetical protein